MRSEVMYTNTDCCTHFEAIQMLCKISNVCFNICDKYIAIRVYFVFEIADSTSKVCRLFIIDHL
jgi:hypothetical protein